MQADAVVQAGDFDPPDQDDPGALGCDFGLRPACGGVVIGHGNRLQAKFQRTRHQLAGGQRAVGGRGVTMQVNIVHFRNISVTVS